MGKLADERFMPNTVNIGFDPYMRHFERYFVSVKLLNKIGFNEIWLDYGCGTRYGSGFLTNFCDKVYGYDVDSDTIRYAKNRYGNDNCSFLDNINELNENIDGIFAIEVIEHMPTNDAINFLMNLNKSLKTNGYLIISTPIVKKTNNNPVNKYHCLEYSEADITKLISVEFFIVDTFFVETTFTDGETKQQGYFKCQKQK